MGRRTHDGRDAPTAPRPFLWPSRSGSRSRSPSCSPACGSADSRKSGATSTSNNTSSYSPRIVARVGSSHPRAARANASSWRASDATKGFFRLRPPPLCHIRRPFARTSTCSRYRRPMPHSIVAVPCGNAISIDALFSSRFAVTRSGVRRDSQRARSTRCGPRSSKTGSRTSYGSHDPPRTVMASRSSNRAARCSASRRLMIPSPKRRLNPIQGGGSVENLDRTARRFLETFSELTK